STPSNSVTPATVPDAPMGVTATPSNGQATVSWTAPASNGGSVITNYTVTSSPGNVTVSSAGGATSAIMTGLTNGTAYTFTVTATNERATGQASAPSSWVTPANLPGAPTGVSAMAGNRQATVTWTAPASNGGSAITGYLVISTPGDLTASAGGNGTTA